MTSHSWYIKIISKKATPSNYVYNEIFLLLLMHFWMGKCCRNECFLLPSVYSLRTICLDSVCSRWLAKRVREALVGCWWKTTKLVSRKRLGFWCMCKYIIDHYASLEINHVQAKKRREKNVEFLLLLLIFNLFDTIKHIGLLLRLVIVINNKLGKQ